MCPRTQRHTRNSFLSKQLCRSSGQCAVALNLLSFRRASGWVRLRRDSVQTRIGPAHRIQTAPSPQVMRQFLNYWGARFSGWNGSVSNAASAESAPLALTHLGAACPETSPVYTPMQMTSTGGGRT
jgi:hypothetical protein